MSIFRSSCHSFTILSRRFYNSSIVLKLFSLCRDCLSWNIQTSDYFRDRLYCCQTSDESPLHFSKWHFEDIAISFEPLHTEIKCYVAEIHFVQRALLKVKWHKSRFAYQKNVWILLIGWCESYFRLVFHKFPDKMDHIDRIFYWISSFLLPLSYYRKVIEVMLSIKNFDAEFSSDLYDLRSPEFKKVIFGNWSVSMYSRSK